ncbi:hypothetical protein [Leucobacter luti]|uniref:hypothetical protein n=1 Tax=Leucobacter luti TaxID=340320 RepID=UPI001C688864|nr:hypothetical protein [Leucobacter luti]QYM77125.1 hypothetical protein K1X41_07115 [Leucobacter luti]
MTATNSAPHSAGTEPEDPNTSQASETHQASEADAILAALSRIRGRGGRGFRGPGGHGRRNHDGAAARDSFGSDWSGHSGSLASQGTRDIRGTPDSQGQPARNAGRAAGLAGPHY